MILQSPCFERLFQDYKLEPFKRCTPGWFGSNVVCSDKKVSESFWLLFFSRAKNYSNGIDMQWFLPRKLWIFHSKSNGHWFSEFRPKYTLQKMEEYFKQSYVDYIPTWIWPRKRPRRGKPTWVYWYLPDLRKYVDTMSIFNNYPNGLDDIDVQKLLMVLVIQSRK